MIAAQQRRVLADVIPTSMLVDATLVVGAAAFTGLAAQVAIHIPGTPVPVTGQTFAVLLSGAALGMRRAALGMLLYLVVGLIGVPWFAQGAHGYVAATFGYIVGFVLAAAVVGALAKRGGDKTIVRTVGTMLVGTVLIYAVGWPWLAADLHVSLSTAYTLGVGPFLLGDASKLVLAALILPAAWKLVPKNH